MSTINTHTENTSATNSARKTLGFVMMLDVSGSMASWIDMVKIDAKAFVRCSEAGDQFGINQFNDNASWVYPEGSNPDIVTVSSSREETKKAADKIESIRPDGYTNIGAAISLANTMIAKSTAGIKAFVLLSDGGHNTGPEPDTVLGTTPPVYIAGLGEYLRKEYFDKMLKKNSKSKYYPIPDAVNMMQMFNQIIADSSDSSLMLNNKTEFKTKPGSDSILQKFTISNKNSLVRVSIVWDNKRFKYTSGLPKNDLMNVILYNPDNERQSTVPDITEDGFCIFHLNNAKQGEWKVLIQYATPQPFACTVGAMDLNPVVKSNIDIPMFSKLGEKIPLNISITDDTGVNIPDMTVHAKISKPVKTVENCIAQYKNEMKQIELPEDVQSENGEISKLNLLRERKLNELGIDIFERNNSHQFLLQNKEGAYIGTVEDTSVEGIYTIELQMEGINPKTGIKFTTIKTHSVFVG